MKNFKKVLALALAMMMVLSTMTTAFAATANADEAQVLYDLGLFDGKSADEYMPALEDAATAPEALKLIGTALGWEVDPDATVTFEDVPAWAVPWVAKAVELGITNGVSETEFGSDVIDGKRVVTWFLRALGYDMDEAWNDTETLAATAGLTIPTSTLRDDIVGVIFEGLKTTPVGGDATLIETIVLGDAAKTAIAEDAGLVDATLAIESVMISGVKTVDVKLNKAVDTDTTTVQVKKGAAIYSSAVVWNDAKNMATVTTVIELPAADYSVVVTTADETLTETLTVAAEAAATVEVTSTMVDDDTAAAQVAFAVKNQYGEDMEVKANDANLTVSAYNVTQAAAVPVVEPAEAYFTINTAAVADDFVAGDVIRFTVTFLGMTTQANVTVMDPSDTSTIVLGDITLVDDDDTMLDETDGTVKLGYTLLDQYGEVADLSETAAAALPATIDGVQFISSDTGVISHIAVNADNEIVLTVAGDGTAVLTAVVNATGSVANTSIVVNGASAVDTVVISAPTTVVANGETVELDLVVTDQYGTTLDNTSLPGTLLFSAGSVNADGKLEVVVTEGTFTVNAGTAADADAYGTVSFTVEATAFAQTITAVAMAPLFENGAAATVTVDDITAYDQYNRAFTVASFSVAATTNTVVTVAGGTVTAAAVGTDTLTFTATGASDTATFDVAVEVIAAADITGYTMSEVGTIYTSTDAAYTADVTVKGLKDGAEVNLVTSTPDIVTSSNVGVASVSGAEVTGVAAGSAVISVWMDGVKVDSETITVSDETPYAVAIELDATAATALAATKVTDQYGVEITDAADLFFVVDGASVASGYVLVAGDELTVITTNGLTATVTAE